MSKLKETKRRIKQRPKHEREAVNDLVKLLNNHVITYCDQYVNPNMLCILTMDKSKSEYPVSAGSGFIYHYDDMLYFITANHVINDISNTYLLISTTQNINPIFLYKLGISRDKPYISLSSFIDVENSIIDDKHDLYIAPLTYQDFRYVSNSIVAEDYFQSFVAEDYFQSFVVTGFPVSKNSNYVNESFLSNHDIILINSSTDADFVTFEDENIFIDYEKTAISVRGCSGSPLVQLGWLIRKVEEEQTLLDIIGHDICGVLIECENQKITYTSISVVHELLNKNIPAVLSER